MPAYRYHHIYNIMTLSHHLRFVFVLALFKDHWEVVSGSEGSVFKKSVPHCMTSASIYVFLWYLMEYCDYDWSQPDGAPVSFDIATLFVSFALIVLFKIAYKRYEKAAQGLSRYHYCVKNFALKIVVFSGLDNSSDANKWRLLVSALLEKTSA